MAEKLRKVERFSELRAGDALAFQCGWCETKHRQTLLRIEVVVRDDGPETIARCEPGIVCLSEAPIEPWGFTPLAVADGRVFRIDFGTEDTKTTEATKTRERVE